MSAITIIPNIKAQTTAAAKILGDAVSYIQPEPFPAFCATVNTIAACISLIILSPLIFTDKYSKK